MNNQPHNHTRNSSDAPDRDALREAFRDGSLTADEQAAFEAELKRDPQFADDVEAESRWLGALAEIQSSDAPADGEPFAASVLAKWPADTTDKPLVRRSTILLWAGSAAAAAVLAIAVTVANHANADRNQQEANLPPLPNNVILNPTRETDARQSQSDATIAAKPVGDSVGVILGEVHASITTRPTEILSNLSSRLTSIELDRLPELAPMSLPDPADWLNHNKDETADTQQAPA